MIKYSLAIVIALLLTPLYVAHAAIALDTSLAAQVVTASSLTYSYTTSGSDRILVIMVYSAGADHITGVTYNGVAMTQATKGQNTADLNSESYIYYLKNPASGAHNVVISSDASVLLVGMTISYTGALQTGTVDVGPPTYNNISASGDKTVAVTISANNSWIFVTDTSKDANPVSAVNATIRRSDFNIIADSNGPLSTGSNSAGFHWNSASRDLLLEIAFAPSVPAASASLWQLFPF